MLFLTKCGIVTFLAGKKYNEMVALLMHFLYIVDNLSMGLEKMDHSFFLVINIHACTMCINARPRPLDRMVQ